ncbi:MAG TPA: ATP-binding protein [Syntrophales bacterium]|nr:ATP-binding protein [Syntrophales bacterium]
MIPQNKVIWQHRSPKYDRRFLQPIAVAIVCAVFIGLILTMGIMDLRRSDRILMGFMENQGLRIIGVVERLSQENLNAMIQAYKRDSGSTTVPLVDEALLPQKSLTTALVELARTIDKEWKAGHLNEEYLVKCAEEKSLWYVAVLNRQGKAVYQSRSLPADLIGGSPSAVIRKEDINVDLFAKLGSLKRIGFVALRRKDGSGTVIIALDRDGQRYWGVKVSVEKALEGLGHGQGQGLVYITVTDQRDMLLGSAGQVPEKWERSNAQTAEILAGTKKFESRKIVSNNKKILDIAAPINLFGKVAGVARLGLDREGTDEIIEENKRNIILFMSSIILITLLSMWTLYHNQNRHLAGIVEMERQLEKAERLSALGHLAAGVAHEIRNPLNAISMASQRLKREFMPADEDKIKEFQTLAGVIRDEIRRLDGIIEEFLTFSKSRRLELHDYPVSELLQKIVNLIREEAASKGIKVETRYNGTPAIIPMDVDKLEQAIINFVKNAMESISGEGSVIISVDSGGKDRVSIKISDNGCGMSVEEVERIFNPEYTTKEKGLGLGLPLAHEIIRGHGGEIRVSSRPGSGTTFEILLPRERAGDKNGKTEGTRA